MKNKQDIQKTSLPQLLILAGFILYIFAAVNLFNTNFEEKPSNLWSKFGVLRNH